MDDVCASDALDSTIHTPMFPYRTCSLSPTGKENAFDKVEAKMLKAGKSEVEVQEELARRSSNNSDAGESQTLTSKMYTTSIWCNSWCRHLCMFDA